MYGLPAHRLARRAAVGRRHTIGRQEPAQRARERWVGSAIGLARRIRRHRRSLRIDCEVGSVVSDVVIAQHARGAQRRANCVWASRNGFTRRAAIGRREPSAARNPLSVPVSAGSAAP